MCIKIHGRIIMYDIYEPFVVLEQRLSRKIRDENTENEITTDNKKISIRCDEFAIISFLGFFDEALKSGT